MSKALAAPRWQRRRLLAVLALFFLAGPAAAIDAKCSACSAVAGELRTVLETEKPRDPIDLRNRLDSKGVRYGKVLDWHSSDQRMTELLDGLCKRVEHYALWTPPEEWTAAHPEDAGRGWYKTQGEGLHAGAGAATELRGAKGDAMSKEVQAFCGRLVEETEEGLTAALRQAEFNASAVQTLLCSTLSKSCRRRPPGTEL